MGQSGSRAGGNDGQSNEERKEKKKSKYEQPDKTSSFDSFRMGFCMSGLHDGRNDDARYSRYRGAA